MRFLVALFTFGMLLIAALHLHADEAIKASVSGQSIVIPAGYHNLNCFPDEPISLLGTKPYRFLMVCDTGTVLMQGDKPETAVPLKKVLTPGPKKDFDNGYAGICSTYIDKKTKKVYAFYHAENHADMPKVPYNPDVQGGYWSIGLATSTDNGTTFTKAGQILRASITKKEVTKEHQGIGDVCVIPDASNTYFYAYYTDLTRRKSDLVARIAVARSRIADGGRPGTWFKYHDGDFKEKGLGGNESPVVNPPAAFPSEVIEPSVVYAPQWKKYLMACVVVAYKDFENKKADKGGIAFCYSDDGLKWSEPKVLIVGLPVPLQDREYLAHPTLILDNVTAKKADGQLLYCYSPKWGRPEDKRVPHHLAKRTLTVTVGE